MAKTKSFVEKQANELKYQSSFNASFLHLYEKELRDKETEYLEEFAKSHNEEETAKEKANQDVLITAKLESKAGELQSKLDKKEYKYKKRNKTNATRIWEIDLVRGLVIIGMLIDHFFFDFYGLFTKNLFSNLPQFYLELNAFANLYWVHPVRVTFRFIGIFFLFIVSGISCHFSRNSLKRSFLVIAAGAIMSVAFIVVANFEGNLNDLVIVGAVGCIGICMLIYSLFKIAFYRFKKIYKWLLLVIALAILVAWYFVQKDNAIDTSNFWFYYNGYYFTIPVVKYRDLGPNLWRVLLGLSYFGSDWMGLFPALGYTFLGAFIGETVYKNRKSLFGKYNETLNRKTLPLIIPGRYSLWFYLSHQIIYIIILGALALLMGAQLLI